MNKSKKNGVDILVFKEWLSDMEEKFMKMSSHQGMLLLDRLISLADHCQLHHLAGSLNCLMKRDFLEMLPNELSHYLLSFLDVRSLRTCCLVSRAWKNRVNGCTSVWRRACLSIGCALPSLNTYNSTILYKQLYSVVEQRQKDLRSHLAWTKTTLVGHSAQVTAMFYLDNTLVTGSDDRHIRIWNCTTGKCTKVFTAHIASEVKFDKQKQKLFTAAFDCTAACWDMQTGDRLQQFIGHVSAVLSVDFNLTQDIVITGSYDSSAKLWSLSSGDLLRTFHEGIVGPVKQVRLAYAKNDLNASNDKKGNGSDAFLTRCFVYEEGRVHAYTLRENEGTILHSTIDHSWGDKFLPNLCPTGNDRIVCCVYDRKLGNVKLIKSQYTESEGYRNSEMCTIKPRQRTEFEKMLGCGKKFCAFRTYGDRSSIDIWCLSREEKIASIPLHEAAWKTRTCLLGDCGWMDGFKESNTTGLLFACSDREKILLFKWIKQGINH